MKSPQLPDHELRRLRSIAANQAHFHALVEAREAGEPLQYLEGSVQFGPVEVAVDSRVLIPRPETENLFALITANASSPNLIVDLCTGSGALAVALKHAFPSARVIGTDSSVDALEVARSNGTEVEWQLGDLFLALPADLRGRVDLLVANPPYVATAEWDELPVDVRREPKVALVGGPHGTEVIEEILRELPEWLAQEGQAWIEIGETQAWLADRYPVEVLQDQYGVDRYLQWT